MSAFNTEQFEKDFSAQRITPERAEEMAQDFRDAHDDELEKAASILERSGDTPDDKTRKRIDRIEAKAAEHLRAANDIEAFLYRPLGRKVGSSENRTNREPAIVVSGFSGQSKQGFANWAQSKMEELRGSRPQNAAATGGLGEQGGFMIPGAVVSDLMDRSLAREVVRPRADVRPMSSRQLTIAAPDWTNNTDAKRAGVRGEFKAEGAAASTQNPKFRAVGLHAHTQAIFVDVSQELEEDAPDFGMNLEKILSEAMASTLDTKFLFGSGVNEPLGIFESPALITVPKVSSQLADTITFENLVQMAARLTPGAWSRATWVASQTALPKLFKLTYQATDDTATAISGTGVSAPVLTVTADGQYSLLGRPLLISEKMKQLGDVGDIGLFDFSEYIIGLRKDAELIRSIDPEFKSYVASYRLIIRVTGAPGALQITPEHSAPAVSPFVCLAARA